ncbi:MAG: tetratricopeptide repeat protein [Polyangiaceae bacterium]|nr:tetratricopeptide repeat protein [Polyangiaceae bacterium]
MAILLAVLMGCAGSTGSVTRRVDGVLVRTRRVDERALAVYARARQADVRGQRDEALAEYARVLELDPESSEAWTRVGALRCERDWQGARAAFARAEALAPGSPELARARAWCELGLGDGEAALRAAREAISVEPESVEGSLVYARALAATGDLATAQRWLEALVLRAPSAQRGWVALQDLATRTGDVALARRAEAGGAVAGVELRPNPRRERARTAVDVALMAHALADARAVAVAAGISEARLALRALALGRPEVAAEAANVAFTADSTDSEAWIAALVAASIGSDRGRLEALATELEPAASRPGPVAVALFAELLDREVGPAAAAAWLAAQPPLDPRGDPTERAVLERVLETLPLQPEVTTPTAIP